MEEEEDIVAISTQNIATYCAEIYLIVITSINRFTSCRKFLFNSICPISENIYIC